MPKECYRHSASVVLLRPSTVCSPEGCGTAYQVLLIHKPRKRDAWQLPQGGVEEGERIEEAALRELHEEAGITGIELLGKSEILYEYDFPDSYRRFRPDNVKGQRIHFVFALDQTGATVHVDGREIDSHVWVEPHDLRRFIKRKEYLKTLEKLLKEGISLAERRRKGGSTNYLLQTTN